MPGANESPKRKSFDEIGIIGSAKKPNSNSVSDDLYVKLVETKPGIVLLSVVRAHDPDADAYAAPLRNTLRGDRARNIPPRILSFRNIRLHGIANRVNPGHRNNAKPDPLSGYPRIFYVALRQTAWNPEEKRRIADAVCHVRANEMRVNLSLHIFCLLLLPICHAYSILTEKIKTMQAAIKFLLILMKLPAMGCEVLIHTFQHIQQLK
jgi:hypothetical protein